MKLNELFSKVFKNLKEKSDGFSHIELIASVLVIGVVGGLGAYVNFHHNKGVHAQGGPTTIIAGQSFIYGGDTQFGTNVLACKTGVAGHPDWWDISYQFDLWSTFNDPTHLIWYVADDAQSAEPGNGGTPAWTFPVLPSGNQWLYNRDAGSSIVVKNNASNYLFFKVTYSNGFQASTGWFSGQNGNPGPGNRASGIPSC